MPIASPLPIAIGINPPIVVSEVIKIAEDQIEPAPDFGMSVRRDFIRGIGKVGKRFVILLEPDRALDVQEMADLCEAAQEVVTS